MCGRENEGEACVGVEGVSEAGSGREAWEGGEACEPCEHCVGVVLGRAQGLTSWARWGAVVLWRGCGVVLWRGVGMWCCGVVV